MATAQRKNIAYGLDNPLQQLYPLPIASHRAPTTRDKAQIGSFWVDTLTNTTYCLTSITANVAQWSNLVGSGTGIFPAVEATAGDITADVGNFVATLGTFQIATINNTMLITDGTGHIVSPGAATNGQILIGSTGAAPALATLTAGPGVTITNGAGAITIAVPGVSVFWQVIAADQVAVVDNGYICNKAGLLTLTLPAIAAVGDTISVTGKNIPVGWRVAQNAGQTIHLGAAATTTGVAGYLESTQLYDTVELVCVTTNTDWMVADSVGSITVA